MIIVHQIRYFENIPDLHCTCIVFCVCNEVAVMFFTGGGKSGVVGSERERRGYTGTKDQG